MITQFSTADVATNFEDIRADYTNQNDDRFRRHRVGLPAFGASADYHFKSDFDYYRIVEQARDFERNDSLVAQTIDRLVANVVQDGFTLIPETGDPALDEELYTMWCEWASDPDECDISGEWCWNDFETLSYRTCLVDGDCLIAGTRSGHLQFYEAHNIAKHEVANEDENTFLGVTIDDNRKRNKYWISKDPVSSWRRTNVKLTSHPLNTRTKIGDTEIRQLFHILDQKRSTLTRGVSALYPIFVVLGIVEDINFAKLVQQQVASCFAIFRQQSENAGATLPGGEGYGATTYQDTITGEMRQLEGIQPGMQITGRPGEELKGFSPPTPNPEFFEHMRQQLSIIGANLDLSASQVVLDFTQENFVGYRGALHEARKGIARRQKLLKKRLHTPAYKFKVAQWISEGKIRSNRRRKVDPFRHVWQPPAFEYLEPINDAKGDLIRVQNSLTSRRRLHAERGVDWETIASEQVEDISFGVVKAIEKANEVNDMFPDLMEPVSYRDFLPLPTAEGASRQKSLEANPNDIGSQENSGGSSKAE